MSVHHGMFAFILMRKWLSAEKQLNSVREFNFYYCHE